MSYQVCLLNLESHVRRSAYSATKVRKTKKGAIGAGAGFKFFSYRKAGQFGFLLVILFIGIKFILFVSQLERGELPSVSRPPGVEAFLPISALISLKYWLLTGILNSIHPASVIILLIVLSLALFLKKGFCSWVCPFGLLSEYLERVSWSLFRRQVRPPRSVDYFLRSLKYLILGFFLWAIFVRMGLSDLASFIYSPYNRIADIKMLEFFAEMSTTTFWVLVALVLLSALIPYFWCRYLCPYGALLGLLSLLSPFKIRRNQATCIDCSRCGRVCPAGIKVEAKKSVYSDECHACFRCIDACPVQDALSFSLPGEKKKISRLAYAGILIFLFLVGTTIPRLTGHWHNSLSPEEYSYHIERLDEPEYQHNRGQVPDYDYDVFLKQFSLPEKEKNKFKEVVFPSFPSIGDLPR
ncbi:MAG: 4Fe-4S binding protein [Candidatus Aminicenantales bacterium]